MKKILGFFATFVLGVIICLSVFACTGSSDDNPDVTGNEKKVVSISVDKSTIPNNSFAGSVKLTQIMLNVLYDNGESEDINLSSEYISVKSVNLLNVPGTQVIEVIYENCRCNFNIYLLDPTNVNYKLTVRGGIPISVDGDIVSYQAENGVFEAEFPRGTLVVIDWIDEIDKVFAYWQVGGSPVDNQRQTAITINADYEYIAVSEDDLHTVIFVTNIMTQDTTVNIAPIKKKSIDSEKEIVEEITLDGYVFIGWTTTPISYEDSLTGTLNVDIVKYPYEIKEDITFYAVWTPIGFEYAPTTIEYAGMPITGQEITAYKGTLTNLVIPASCENGTVISISKDAFSRENAKMLTSITIPSSIMRIEEGAFSNCTSLQNFYVDNSSRNFSSEKGVLYQSDKTVMLAYPAGKIAPEYSIETTVTKVCEYAFYNSVVGGIVVPSDVVSIGDYAFHSNQIDHVDFSAVKCEKIKKSLIENKNIFTKYLQGILVESIDEKNRYSAALPLIADKFVSMRSELNSVYIEENGEILFRLIKGEYFDNKNFTAEIIGVSRLIQELNIPLTLSGQNNDFTVSSIASYAFKDCIELKSISLPLGLERVCDHAFDDTPWAASLENSSIVFNNTIYKYLGNSSTYVLDEDIVRIAEGAFSGNKTLLCIDMPENAALERIDAFAFSDCTKLRSFAIGNSGSSVLIQTNLYKIAPYAFRNTAIKSIETYIAAMNDAGRLTHIGDYAFAECHYLETVNFGMRSLTDISECAFYNCYSMTSFSISENDIYRSISGIVYKKETGGQYSLFHYPSGKITGVFNPSRPNNDTILEVVSLGDYSLHYADIGALELEESVVADNAKALFLPSIVYVRFLSRNTLHNSSYKSIFANTGAKQFIFEDEVSSDAVAAFFGHDTVLISEMSSRSTNCSFYYNDKILYALQNGEAIVVGADRSAESSELIIPATVTLNGENFSQKAVGAYSICGFNVQKIKVSGITEFENNALSGAYALKELFIEDEDVDNIPIIYQDSLGGKFNGELKIFVNCDPSLPNSYFNKWENTIKVFTFNDEFGIQHKAAENLIYDAPFIVLTYIDDNGIKQTSSIQRNVVSAEALYDINGKKPGYSVGGWKDANGELFEELCDGYIIKKNLVLECEWLADKYTIIFAINSDIKLAFENVEYLKTEGEYSFYKKIIEFGADYDFNVENLRANATNFDGWKNGETKIDVSGTWSLVIPGGEIILYPQTSKKEYTVEYDTSDTGMIIDEMAKTVYYGEPYTLTVPTKRGYNFVEWRTKDGLALTDANGACLTEWRISSSLSVKIYPVWKAKIITVTLMLEDGDFYGEVGIAFASNNYSIPLNRGDIPIEIQNKYVDIVEFFAGWEDINDKVYTDAYGEALIAWDKYDNPVLYAIWPKFILSQEQLIDTITADETASVVLRCDINLREPISATYNGVFNGNGHTVTLTCDGSQSPGIFSVNNGTIKNAIFEINILRNISSNDDVYYGGICGINNGIIENIDANLSLNLAINMLAGKCFIGGIMGLNNGTVIKSGLNVNIFHIDVLGDNGKLYIGSLAGANTGNISLVETEIGLNISNFSINIGNLPYDGKFDTIGSVIGSNAYDKNNIGVISGNVRMIANDIIVPYNAYKLATPVAREAQRNGLWEQLYSTFYCMENGIMVKANSTYYANVDYYVYENTSDDYFADKRCCFGLNNDGNKAGLTFTVLKQ